MDIRSQGISSTMATTRHLLRRYSRWSWSSKNAAYMMKAPFNHGVHIVLDFVTCGAWIPIHLICWAVH